MLHATVRGEAISCFHVAQATNIPEELLCWHYWVKVSMQLRCLRTKREGNRISDTITYSHILCKDLQEAPQILYFEHRALVLKTITHS